MNLLVAENISKSYSEKVLFDNISLGIEEGDKIGLIGINGTGKSTLLKVIAGEESSDTGKITMGNSVRIEYLPQNPDFDMEATVLKQVFKGDSPVMQLIREYEEVLDNLAQKSGDQSLEKKIIDLSQKMDALDAWRIESEAKSILTRLGICDFKARIGTLSGGQRKRVAMASALINPVDLLILDEPTNHVDNETVDWLEDYLNKRKGALLMVTHDRYFLDRVANRIIEIDNGRLYSYSGNYSKFLEMKVEREELQQASERKRQNLLRNELEWIKRGAKARSTKQKARIERFEKLSQDELQVVSDKIDISVGSTRLGRKIIELQHVSKAFSSAKLIDDFSYILLRDDRVGIVGPNGAGKSTLLNIIGDKLKADTGKVDIGQTVKIGFFSQESSEMDQNLRVIDYIKEEAEVLTTPDGVITASQMLERFLFPPNVQWTPISKLSGGEKRRLYLLRVLMGAPNVLLLDEPTNDLDIHTLTILESYLDDFPGAVITVSHDRYFLDRTVDKIFALEGNGTIEQYVGNYSDYYKIIQHKNTSENTGNSEESSKADKNSNEQQRRRRQLKFTFNEQREYDQIDDIIARLENDLKEINKQIDDCASDFERLQELLSKQQALEKQLEDAIERWTYLNELAEQIESEKANNIK